MSKKSHHFLTLWPWPLTYDLEKLIRSGHYHYQCVYQIWEQSIPWFLSYRVNTIAGGGRRAAGGGRRAAGGGRLRRKTITSPDPSDTGDIITLTLQHLNSQSEAVFRDNRQLFFPSSVFGQVGLVSATTSLQITYTPVCRYFISAKNKTRLPPVTWVYVFKIATCAKDHSDEKPTKYSHLSRQ